MWLIGKVSIWEPNFRRLSNETVMLTDNVSKRSFGDALIQIRVICNWYAHIYIVSRINSSP